MPLTDAKLKALKPKLRPYKVSDRHSLYVIVSPAGGLAWKFNYQFGGLQKTLSLGRWPAVSLHAARDARDAAQRALADGIDPAVAKQERKRVRVDAEKPTFEEAAREWHVAQLSRWTDDYAAQILARLEADVFPHIGAMRFADLKRGDIIDCLRKVEARGVLETARRLRQYIGAIHRFAGAEDESIIDPTPMLKGALATPPKAVHYKAFKPNEIGEFLFKLQYYDGEPVTRLAITVTMLTAARTSEVIESEWPEFERRDRAEIALWRVPGPRMKMDDPHLVPLSRQACEALTELHAITGKGRYLFPESDGRRGHISYNTMLFAAYRMGFKGRATIHGLRTTFSTWANENASDSNGWNSDDVELCLAHAERNESRAAYNAAQRLAARRVLLQAWADYLDSELRRYRREA